MSLKHLVFVGSYSVGAWREWLEALPSLLCSEEREGIVNKSSVFLLASYKYTEDNNRIKRLSCAADTRAPHGVRFLGGGMAFPWSVLASAPSVVGPAARALTRGRWTR